MKKVLVMTPTRSLSPVTAIVDNLASWPGDVMFPISESQFRFSSPEDHQTGSSRRETPARSNSCTVPQFCSSFWPCCPCLSKNRYHSHICTVQRANHPPMMDTGDLAYNVKLSVCCWEGQRRIEIGELSRAKKCEGSRRKAGIAQQKA